MKPFSFNLEKVLNLRKYNEDEAKAELGRAVSILAGLEARLNSLGRERARAATEQFASGNSAALIQQYMYYLVRLDNTIEEVLSETALAEQKVEEAREVFLEASRERKVLDNLKEKRRKEYRKEALAAETKVLDDISSGKNARVLVSE